jgi:hypothetical protein
MRIRVALPDAIVNAKTLGAALELATLANEGLSARKQLPSFFDALEKRAFRWKPENFSDGEHFDLAPTVLARGWGDCDDLAPWLCAELRKMGQECRPIAYKSGTGTWHAVVEMADGRILDPSVWAGMKKPTKGRDNPGVHGQFYAPLAAPEQDALALVPYRDGWAGRADMYLDDGQHLASTYTSRDPRRALERAVAGYCAFADGVHGECIGADTEIGSFFSDIVSTVAPIASAVIPGAGLIAPALSLAKPLLSSVTSALAPGGAQVQIPPPPQGYAPGAAPARTPMAQAPINLPGRNPGSVQYSPFGGPIIVRF